ncbi:MAG: class I SAM-dependent methyltransferase, partial [Solirubrobacteraceae bacterium]
VWPGSVAKRLREDHDISVCAIDLSERMVDLARGLRVDARVVDRETARAYIAASIKAPELADRFPELEQPLRATSRNCVLIARKP